MKKKFLKGLVASFALAVSGLANAGILYYVDANNGLVDSALTDLGLTYSITGHSNFLTDLNSQSWDMVIIDTAGREISSSNTTAIDNYINSGGKSIISHWLYNGNSALSSAYDVAVTSSFSSPLDVYLWDTSHELFTGVTGMFDYSDNAGDNGDRFSAINGAQALAGFTPSLTSNDAAIVLGNGGNTIANGWLFWDADINPNNTKLISNQVEYLLNGSVATEVPEPSTLAIFALGLMGLASRKFKKQA